MNMKRNRGMPFRSDFVSFVISWLSLRLGRSCFDLTKVARALPFQQGYVFRVTNIGGHFAH